MTLEAWQASRGAKAVKIWEAREGIQHHHAGFQTACGQADAFVRTRSSGGVVNAGRTVSLRACLGNEAANF